MYLIIDFKVTFLRTQIRCAEAVEQKYQILGKVHYNISVLRASEISEKLSPEFHNLIRGRKQKVNLNQTFSSGKERDKCAKERLSFVDLDSGDLAWAFQIFPSSYLFV